MNTKIRLALCALAVAAPAWLTARADSPASPQSTGQVLVLDNERTLEGEIERQGEQYRVRRAIGGELWIQSENVLRVCANYKEAYAYLRSRANLHDPDEHLRLGRWCHQHGLKSEALAEVKEAVKQRPNHAESRRLLAILERLAAVSRSTQPARPQEEAEPSLNPPAVTTESLSLFVTKVQPILMNACASCHASGRGGAFKLIRSYEEGLANRKTTFQNLAAALVQVNKDNPQSSPLFIKAVSVHGVGDMAQPPLRSRDVPAFRSLEEWVRVTLANNAQVQEDSAPLLSSLKAVDRSVTSVAPPSKPETNAPVEKTGAREPGSNKVVSVFAASRPAPEATENKSSADAGPVDPFDPAIFNRQMHPQEKSQANKP